jgi:hypothetical protein
VTSTGSEKIRPTISRLSTLEAVVAGGRFHAIGALRTAVGAQQSYVDRSVADLLFRSPARASAELARRAIAGTHPEASR